MPAANQPNQSRAFTLDRVDRAKLRRSAFICVCGAVVTIGPLLLAGFDSQTAVGGVLVAAASFAIDAARRWLRDNSAQK